MKNTRMTEYKFNQMREEAIEIALYITATHENNWGWGYGQAFQGTKGLASLIQDYLDTEKNLKDLGLMVIEEKTSYTCDGTQSEYRVAYKDNEYFGIKEG